jgi:hypothetical protein
MHPCAITGRLISAARALVGVSQEDLAKASGFPLTILTQMEAEGSAIIASMRDAEAVRRALEGFGAVFIAEGDGFGAGVRLKFRRDDARQISRLETEGGIIGSDDVP